MSADQRLSYVHGTSDVPLLGTTIGERLRETVARFGEREALVVRNQDYRTTYAQLWDDTTRLAKALMARGIRRGDRVGMWSPNRFEWLVAQYATARIGAVLVNVNPAYRAAELEYALNQSGQRMLLHAKGFRTTDYGEILGRVRGNCPQLEASFVLDTQWEELHAPAPETSDEALAAREATLTFDDPINIQYTSGTTGSPKGATLSHHNILNNGYMLAQIMDYSEQDRVCVPVPFYHCFGMVMGNLASMSVGACVVIPAEAFDPGATLETIQAERCTSLYGVPTMFIGQLAHPAFDAFDLGSLRTGCMAGSPCPVEVMKQVIERMNMKEVTIAYGMTETSPVSTQTRGDDTIEKRVGSVGRVHPHVEVKIIDPEMGVTVPRGVRGELCTRGYSVMLGYWNNEEATKNAIDAGRWMHTGDLATMDDEGYVNITGRIKDMIIRGGENIYPREVEEYLYRHPAVEDAQVIGIPSEKYGEEVMAWVKVAAGESVTEDDLVAFCKGNIATFKIPKFWRLCDEFPMTVTGKIQKFKMRDISIQELGLADAAAAQTA
ncbi:MAG: AMP-binding protein [Myxococcota bacterium]